MNATNAETAQRLEAAKSEFFLTGTQYYVAGRYAVIAGLIPVAGNLLHHAVEMFLKGGLSSRLTLEELRPLGHNLPKIWEAFKAQVGNDVLKRFDPLVRALDEFETLRYPNSIVSRGAQMTMGVTQQPIVSEQQSRPPAYALSLAETDPLVGAIFEAASVNPKFFVDGLLPHAQRYLRDTNSNPWAG